MSNFMHNGQSMSPWTGNIYADAWRMEISKMYYKITGWRALQREEQVHNLNSGHVWCFYRTEKKRGWLEAWEEEIWEETTILCGPVRSSYRLPFLWVNWEDMGRAVPKLCFNKIPMDIVYRTERSCSIYMGY